MSWSAVVAASRAFAYGAVYAFDNVISSAISIWRVARYLGQKHGELRAQLQKVVEVSSLEA